MNGYWKPDRFTGALLITTLLLPVACRSPGPKPAPAMVPKQEPPRAPQWPEATAQAAGTQPAVAVATRPAAEQDILLGESVQGRPINLFIFGEGGETTLIIGGIHGDEPTGSDVAGALIEHLREHPESYAGRCIMIAPAVNPDGLVAHTRHNANGVDLNRNFPASNFPRQPGSRFAGGREPLSEPESQAIMAAIELARPTAIISLHSMTRGRHGNNYDGPARPIAEEMTRWNGYPVLPTMGYATPGSLGSWAGVDRGIPTITLELPRGVSGPTCWDDNRNALLAAIRFPGNTPPAVDPPVLGK